MNQNLCFLCGSSCELDICDPCSKLPLWNIVGGPVEKKPPQNVASKEKVLEKIVMSSIYGKPLQEYPFEVNEELPPLDNKEEIIDEKLLLKVKNQLLTIKDKFPRNNYFTVEELHLLAYIRIGRRIRKQEWVNTIDVANVTVEEEERKKGNLTKYLSIIETIAKEWDYHVYAENVLESFLIKFLLKRGYECDNNFFSEIHSYWKKPK